MVMRTALNKIRLDTLLHITKTMSGLKTRLRRTSGERTRPACTVRRPAERLLS